jgi:preprotein translocase subunit SecG
MQGILNVLLVVHLIIALLLIGLILLQKSEGGALGIGGSGAGGGNIFSARGIGTGLTRATAILAICFFITSIALTVLASRQSPSQSVFESAPAETQGQPAGGQEQNGGSLLPNLGPGTGGQGSQPSSPPTPSGN